MAKLLSVTDALAKILDGVKPLDEEAVAIVEACGRVLARPVSALFDQPPFPASAMDGYACRAEDCQTLPAHLKMIGVSAAGHPFAAPLGPGEAVRIFTGSIVPGGADSIAIQENVEALGGTIKVLKVAPPGQFIRPRGYDFLAEQALISAPQKLSARQVGLAAGGGHGTLSVQRKPRVYFFSSGDELILPGEKPAHGMIVSTNDLVLRELIRRWGGEPVSLGILPDKPEALEKAIQQAKREKADLLVTLGGASVGDHDLTAAALAAEGMDLSFHRIAMRPGKPLIHGKLGNIPVLGLPGNPVSSYICAAIFLRPLILAMLGLDDQVTRVRARLGRDLPANDEREEYMRAELHIAADGAWVATPFPKQESSLLAPLAKANALLIRPAHAPAANEGEPCEIIRLEEC